jgi:hypothetical protein
VTDIRFSAASHDSGSGHGLRTARSELVSKACENTNDAYYYLTTNFYTRRGLGLNVPVDHRHLIGQVRRQGRVPSIRLTSASSGVRGVRSSWLSTLRNLSLAGPAALCRFPALLGGRLGLFGGVPGRRQFLLEALLEGDVAGDLRCAGDPAGPVRW